MPTYEYSCTSCHRHIDVVQRFSDAPLETCESCGGTLKRVFHPVGIVLKGPGFYSTDNRSGRRSGATPPAKETSKDAGASESAPKAAGEPGKSKPSESGSSGAGTSSGKESSPGKSASGSGSSGASAGSAASGA